MAYAEKRGRKWRVKYKCSAAERPADRFRNEGVGT